MPSEERIYSESEIKQVLIGLATVYKKQPWYMKWYWKSWVAALEVTYTCFCGASDMEKSEVKELADDVENFLGEGK